MSYDMTLALIDAKTRPPWTRCWAATWKRTLHAIRALP